MSCLHSLATRPMQQNNHEYCGHGALLLTCGNVCMKAEVSSAWLDKELDDAMQDRERIIDHELAEYDEDAVCRALAED